MSSQVTLLTRKVGLWAASAPSIETTLVILRQCFRKSEGVITDLHVAFSRDGPKKVYVQHMIAENKESLWEDLQNHGHIYVCG